MNWSENIDSIVLLAQMKTRNVKNDYRWIVYERNDYAEYFIEYMLESWDGRITYKLQFYRDKNNRLFISLNDKELATNACQLFLVHETGKHIGALANAIVMNIDR